MVSIAEIEKHKENLTKRPEGYDIRHLLDNIGRNTAAALPANETAQDEVPDVAQDEAHDPLGTKIAEFSAIRDSIPQKRVIPELVKRMGECIDCFKDWNMYKNDFRFVNLCLQYGSFSESPPMMFQFMESYKIGIYCARFYDQWANYLETTKDFAAAQRVISRGIDVGAEPYSVLKQLKADIEQRCPRVPQKRTCTDSVPQPIAKRPQLNVYRDNDDSDGTNYDESSTSEHVKLGVPQLLVEGKENKQPPEPLVVNSRRAMASARRLQAYQDTSGDIETDEISLNPFDSYFSLQLLANRAFDDAVRRFQSQARSMARGVTRSDTVPVIPNSRLAAVINEQHQGKTEIIGKLQLTNVGDTETLR